MNYALQTNRAQNYKKSDHQKPKQTESNNRELFRRGARQLVDGRKKGDRNYFACPAKSLHDDSSFHLGEFSQPFQFATRKPNNGSSLSATRSKGQVSKIANKRERESLRAMAGKGNLVMASGHSFSVLEWGHSHEIKFFLVSFVDLLGVVRSKLVPITAIDQMQEGGAGFAGYAAHFDMTPADPDVFAFPDPDSVIQLPWKKEVAWVASDLYMNGELVKQAPRQVLKEQIANALAKGYRMKTGVECEFFLLSGDAISVSDAKDWAYKPCYDQGSLMRRFDIISELFNYMEILGWKPYQADHEDGNGQFEMNWEYDDCLKTADKHVFFKFMVKSVAEKHGFRATFMPKPFLNKTGNGAHCHVSIWNKYGNSNLFHDQSGELGLSNLAYAFLGGVLANAKALCGILNPTVNSYKRIDGTTTASGSSWAPTSVSYSGNNRTHMFRIPDEGRFELRLPDGAVNPYLMQAAILASGLHGIEKKLDPGPRSDWNGHLPPPEGQKLEVLPNNLLDALQQLSASGPLREALGVELIESYIKLQMEQWKSYTSHLSRWELDNTLDC